MTNAVSLHAMGEDALTLRFADQLSDAANRAALAFAASLREEPIAGMAEAASGLVSVLVRLERAEDFERVQAALHERVQSQDWFAADLPAARRRIAVPARFSGEFGPGLSLMAEQAGQSEAEIAAQLYATPMRVLAIGFKPGQPYLGFLPDAYRLSRGTALTRCSVGDLATALGQLVLFAAPSPTGWYKVGESALWPMHLQRDPAILLSPGDELCFEETSAAALARAQAAASEGTLALAEERI